MMQMVRVCVQVLLRFRMRFQWCNCSQAMSECSRKDLALQSVCSPDSPMVSPQDGETVVDTNNRGGAKVLS